MGDFNLSNINWSSLSISTTISNQFCDLIFNTSLLQLVDHPTHVHGNILDQILTNENNIIQLLTNLQGVPGNSASLHSDYFTA